MTKKKVYWYGIRTVAYDISVVKAGVARETPKRIYFAEDSGLDFYRDSMLKTSSYEKWFTTREEAVTEKLKMLKRDLKAKGEGMAEARNRLKEFRGRENV